MYKRILTIILAMVMVMSTGIMAYAKDVNYGQATSDSEYQMGLDDKFVFGQGEEIIVLLCTVDVEGTKHEFFSDVEEGTSTLRDYFKKIQTIMDKSSFGKYELDLEKLSGDLTLQYQHAAFCFMDGKDIGECETSHVKNDLLEIKTEIPTKLKGAGNSDCNSNSNTSSQRAETEEERAERLLQEYLSSPIVKESVDTVSSINKLSATSKNTLNLNFEYVTCLTPGMAKAMAAHPNASYVITMKYKGVKYRFTVPAGYDINSLLDKNGYAGVLYLNKMLNGTIVQ